MRGLPQKQNARRAYKIRLCGHLRRYKKIVKKTYIIYFKLLSPFFKGENVILFAKRKRIIITIPNPTKSELVSTTVTLYIILITKDTTGAHAYVSENRIAETRPIYALVTSFTNFTCT